MSTGALAWNLGNGTGEGEYTDINYCMFILWDYTLHKCSWGPFGLLEWDQGVSSSDGPLLYSQMFKILPPNSTDQALITNTAKTTGAPLVTATQGDVTCPPSGSKSRFFSLKHTLFFGEYGLRVKSALENEREALRSLCFPSSQC